MRSPRPRPPAPMIEAVITAETCGGSTTDGGYTLAPTVVAVALSDGTARLLDLAGQVYAVPAPGGLLLITTLSAGPAAAVQAVATRYGVASHQIADDLQRFLHDMERHGLIQCQAPRPPAAGALPTGRQACLIHLLVAALRALNSAPLSLAMRCWIVLALAHGAFRLLGWPDTVAAWRRAYASGTARASTPRTVPPTPALIDRAVRAAAGRHPLAIACKERALCGWGLLQAAGLPAQLVLGLDLFPLAIHSWCELDNQIIGDDADRCERFAPVLRLMGGVAAPGTPDLSMTGA